MQLFITPSVWLCILSTWANNNYDAFKLTIYYHISEHHHYALWNKKISEIRNDSEGGHCTSSAGLGILSVWNNKISEMKNANVVVHYTPSGWLGSLSVWANKMF